MTSKQQASPRRFRKRYIAFAAIGLVIVWMGLGLYGALTMRPGAPLDFAGLVNERYYAFHGVDPERLSPDENGWDELCEAMKIVEGVTTAGHARVKPVISGHAAFDFSALEDQWEWELRDLRAVYNAAVAGVSSIRASKFDSLMTRACEADRIVSSPFDGSVNEADMTWPPLARQTIRYLAGDMALALREGASERYLIDLRFGLRLSDAFAHRWGALDALTARSMEARLLGRLRDDILMRRLDEATLKGVIEELLALRPTDYRYLMAWDYDHTAALMQECYTDDNKGDGRLIISRAIAFSEQFDIRVELTPFLLGNDSLLAGLTSGTYAGKAEVLATAHRITSQAGEQAMLRPFERSDRMLSWLQAEVGAMPSGMEPLRGLLKWRVTESFVMSGDREDTAGAATVTLAAIELFRLRHGRLPDNLHELMPGCLAVLPIDPYSGRPLKYRVMPEDTDVPPFLLYSVGMNGKDDGGEFERTEVHAVWSPVPGMESLDHKLPLDMEYCTPPEGMKVIDNGRPTSWRPWHE